VLIVIGISLFTIGFALTVSELPSGAEMLGSSAESSAVSQPVSVTLVVGFVVSLIGVVLATVAPAMMFMRAIEPDSAGPRAGR